MLLGLPYGLTRRFLLSIHPSPTLLPNRFDSFVAGARIALGSEHDLLLWDIATACEKPSLTHTPSSPSKIGGIVMMGPTGDAGR